MHGDQLAPSSGGLSEGESEGRFAAVGVVDRHDDRPGRVDIAADTTTGLCAAAIAREATELNSVTHRPRSLDPTTRRRASAEAAISAATGPSDDVRTETRSCGACLAASVKAVKRLIIIGLVALGAAIALGVVRGRRTLH